MDILERLSGPFPPSVVSWRVGNTNGDKTKGMALAYIDARDVQDRLNDVCGPFGWQCRHEVSHDKRVTCHVGVRDTEGGDWVWKSDGAGETDYEGEKGSYSDSFKRACVKWGIGRYLYDLDSPWVAVEQKGRSVVIPAASARALTERLAEWQASYFAGSLPKAKDKTSTSDPSWHALDEDTKVALLKLVARIETAAKESIHEAVALWEAAGLNDDEKTATWPHLTSKTRSAMRRVATEQRKAE